MNVKRKTVRFQDSLSDLSVYDAITDYKKYGFRSESHMVIEAVRLLIKNGNSDLDPEKMAELIAEKVAGKLSGVRLNLTEIPKRDEPTQKDVFDAALSFLDNI